MASCFFHNAAKLFMDGTIDLDTHTIKACLVKAAPGVDAEDVADCTRYTGSYTDPTLGTIAITDDDTNNWAKFASATITFSSVGAGDANAVGLVIYKEVGADADDLVVCYNEFTASIMGNGGDITVACPTDGWLHIG